MTTNLRNDDWLDGRFLPFIRALWLILAVGYFALLLASLPNFY